MRPLKQLIKHDPENGAYGDCHRTCLAVILDLEPLDVPHFCDGPVGETDNWSELEKIWLAKRGLMKAAIPIYGEFSLSWILESLKNVSPGVPFILGGRSTLDCNHSVVILDGEIFCDPSGNGIVGPCDDGWWWLELFTLKPSEVQS